MSGARTPTGIAAHGGSGRAPAREPAAGAACKPRALKAGDTVALVAPSGPVPDPERVELAAAAIAALGFRVRIGESCRSRYGYLAGGDDLRAGDVNGAFADDGVDGIVCIKGGYGTPRILDRLDYPLIARHPKVLVGYSDITGIHLALSRRCGFPTFHGPMPSSDMIPEFDPASRAGWLAALTGTGPLGLLANPAGVPPPERLRGGTARGTIIGGNLSLIAATMGTPYEIDTRGRILFIEDIDEAPYRIDRMLTALRLAGKFDDCAGVVLGNFNNCVPGEGMPSLSLAEVFADVILPAGKPVVAGLRAGHCQPSLTIPFGVRAVLDADAPSLQIVEAACAAAIPAAVREPLPR